MNKFKILLFCSLPSIPWHLVYSSCARSKRKLDDSIDHLIVFPVAFFNPTKVLYISVSQEDVPLFKPYFDQLVALSDLIYSCYMTNLTFTNTQLIPIQFHLPCMIVTSGRISRWLGRGPHSAS